MYSDPTEGFFFANIDPHQDLLISWSQSTLSSNVQACTNSVALNSLFAVVGSFVSSIGSLQVTEIPRHIHVEEIVLQEIRLDGHDRKARSIMEGVPCVW